MVAQIEIPAALQDSGAQVTELLVHEFLGGACCCGTCASQMLAGQAPQTAGGAVQAAVAAPTLPSKADILEAMQYDMASLTNDVINTSADPAYTFTYQFAGNAAPDDWPLNSDGDYAWGDWTGWRVFTADEKAAVRAAMDEIEAAVNVAFVEVVGDPDPDLNVGLVTIPGATAGYGGFSYTARSIDNGQTWTLKEMDSFVLYDESLDLTTSPNLLLHELGHALTLKHPFDAPALPAEVESNKYSVMSYSRNPDTNVDANTLQYFDMIALQDRWGANRDTNDAGNRYKGPGDAETLTIWDAGGSYDWLDARGIATDVVLTLNEGEWSRFGSHDDVIIARGVKIEHARGGTGNDTITGNVKDNKLIGGAGNDMIEGGLGADELQGGQGTDTAHGGDGDDLIFGGKGGDTLYGEDGADEVRGGIGSDTLLGGADADALFGGNGRDELDGGTGDDDLSGGRGKDRFIFREGGGADTITDFENDRDWVSFDMDGVTTKFQAAQFAMQDGNDVVYDFGGGDVLRVLNMTVADMADDFNVI